jgi:hypothetical protein
MSVLFVSAVHNGRAEELSSLVKSKAVPISFSDLRPSLDLGNDRFSRLAGVSKAVFRPTLPRINHLRKHVG